MSDFDLKAYAEKGLNMVCDFYVKDLDALSHEDLSTSPGGTARCGYDFTYEVVVVNRRISARMRGEDPGPWPFGEDWATAPDDFKSKEKAKSELQASVAEILAAFDDPLRMIPGHKGDQALFEVVEFASFHTNYHSAQLNYIQSLKGDAKMHWM